MQMNPLERAAIEVTFPFREVGIESAKEKQGIRKGHPVGLHRWWARRPLAACRAALIGSFLDSSDAPAASKLISTLCAWEASPKVYKAVHRHTQGKSVLDCFAGGGAVPLEAMRCGCAATSIDINPVAHLMQRALLEFPQRFGQTNCREAPDYIEILARNASDSQHDLFKPKNKHRALQDTLEGVPAKELPSVTLEEYRTNPLAADVRIWGYWVIRRSYARLSQYYASEHVGTVPVGYLWARSVECPNPTCRAHTPLMRSFRLSKNRPWRVEPLFNPKSKRFTFHVHESEPASSDLDGNTKRDSATCLACGTSISGDYLRSQGTSSKFTDIPIAVVLSGKATGKTFRQVGRQDISRFEEAEARIAALRQDQDSSQVFPDEPLKYLRSIFNVCVYGCDTWSKLFNARQLLVMTELCSSVRAAISHISSFHTDSEYVQAVACYLGLIVSRFADYLSNTALWEPKLEAVLPTFVRQALAMVWDYCEIAPFGGTNGYLDSAVDRTVEIVEHCSKIGGIPACVKVANAEHLPFPDDSFDCVITDPPYYDAVPYSDLSDFFYVWLKRSISVVFPDLFRTPLTPKRAEIVQLAERNPDYKNKTKAFFEEHLRNAFREAHRVLKPNGIATFMFAHRTTAAWETLVSAINGSGFRVTASWPIATEMAGRRRAKDSAALASSIFIVCRKRSLEYANGYWDEVRSDLRKLLTARLDEFWLEGIRGADFFISAIGPALSVFGKYERVTKLSGDEVTVAQFLDEVRGVVTNYALAKILKTTQTASIDPESRFYVVWKWAYGSVKVPAGESFTLAQALGMPTELMWDRTGVLEKMGENVQAMPIAKRIKLKDLGEPNADGSPGSLIDVLHRLCVFREKNDADSMAEYLSRSGQGSNPTLWLVAQAISEILPEGDKEKQLMQGLLNQKETLEQATGQRRLF
jgi:adenine-specific DNA methylase